MKAARLQKMKDDMTRKEPSVSPDVDEEEVLRDAAKRTVEGIPGLMKEEKSGGGEEAGVGETNEEIISQESGGVTERPKPPFKQYSDKGNSPSYHSPYTLPLSLSSAHRKSKLAASAFKYCDWMKVLELASWLLRWVEKSLYTPHRSICCHSDIGMAKKTNRRKLSVLCYC